MSSPTRKIGGAKVNPIGFGAMGISVFYGAVGSDEERFKVLDAVYESGCNHWDTADLYGDSEELIGKWLKRTGKRSDIFLATKFAVTPNGIRGDAPYVKEAFERSLKKLGVDYVDLYYYHRTDIKVPIEETVGAMAELVKEGKVKYLGLSECSPNSLRRAHAVHPIAAVQVEFSPLVLDIESSEYDLLKTARELGVTVVAYSPLARGIITGQIKSTDELEEDDFRRSIPKYSKENFPKILDIVNQLTEIGKKHNATPGQVTLAWILAQGDDFLVIPGTKKIKYVKENMGAANVKLSPEEVARIRKIAEDADKAIPDKRYMQFAMDMLNVETPLPQKS
ncbi:aldo keto reductase [Moniliophthora roreri MCA 2997]|uniref:Aldo keto reductase n=1 Tax=Moniliophthora roreri (strain MCA 2997) TaxID=1381753 RepID=V2X0M7_MONRO|nr:aldo keto reductase [Moniliophthora roreri MCA 2997]